VCQYVFVLPLSEVSGVRKSVDDEWRSPVADAVGEPWDIVPGCLRFWRSSAVHVFVLPPGSDHRGVLYARFAPYNAPAGLRLRQGAELGELLGAAGAAVAGVVRSRSGAAVERVSTPLGDMAACVLRRVGGEELDADDLTAGDARAWGLALADFHRTAWDVAGPAAPRPEPEPARAADAFAALAAHARGHGDAELALAAGHVGGLYAGLDPGPLVFGHGDFELDNLRWSGGQAACFDLDEAGVMPAPADVASAVRDLLGPRPGSPQHPRLLAAFLDGYRFGSGRAISPEELLLHRAFFAAGQVLEAPAVLDLHPAGTGWLPDLAASLVRHYAGERAIILATAAVAP
jgi:Ser/Thr protein kinase RdoA (MazF antagonist)